MKMSTLIAVSLAFAIGAAVGIAKFSGRFSLPVLASQVRSAAATTADQDKQNDGETKDVENSDDDNAVSTESALFDKAEAYLDDNPHDRKRALIYGGKLVEAGEFQRAEEFYKSRLSAAPRDADFLYGLGWTYEQSKTWDKAIELYSQTLQVDSQHLAAKNNLAWVLATAPEESLRDGARAVRLAEQAMTQAGPRARFVADTLAAAYAEAGKFDYAVKFQKWVVDESPPNKRDDARSRLELYEQGKPYRSE